MVGSGLDDLLRDVRRHLLHPRQRGGSGGTGTNGLDHMLKNGPRGTGTGRCTSSSSTGTDSIGRG